MTEKITVRYYASGNVQGVFYRAYAKEEALQLGITGFAKNLSDGRVEVIAYGERNNLLRFYESLKKGPKFAEVHEVTYEEMPLEIYDDFKKL